MKKLYVGTPPYLSRKPNFTKECHFLNWKYKQNDGQILRFMRLVTKVMFAKSLVNSFPLVLPIKRKKLNICRANWRICLLADQPQHNCAGTLSF